MVGDSLLPKKFRVGIFLACINQVESRLFRAPHKFPLCSFENVSFSWIRLVLLHLLKAKVVSSKAGRSDAERRYRKCCCAAEIRLPLSCRVHRQSTGIEALSRLRPDLLSGSEIASSLVAAQDR